MLQDIAPHRFDNTFHDYRAQDGDIVCCFRESEIIARINGEELELPRLCDVPDLAAHDCTYAFSIDETRYFIARERLIALPPAFPYIPQWSLRSLPPSQNAFAAATAESLWRWYSAARYCGKCGAEMVESDTERAMVCPACGYIHYPRLNPSVIVAVTNGDRLLLTKYAGRAFRRYALVAGYCEIGETAEDTVRREVAEETGLRVKNLRFYKSQPWVFTDSLLMGFFCDLEGSDEVHLQTDELSEGTWFTRDTLPDDHSNNSLTGEMIELFRAGGEPK